MITFLLDKNADVDPEEHKKKLDQIEDEYFEKYYKKKNSNNKQIPKFFFKVPKEEEDIIRHKFREESRAIFLQRRSRALLDNNELKVNYNLFINSV